MKYLSLIMTIGTIFGVIVGNPSKADQCDCTTISTYPAPNKQTHYSITCHKNGEKQTLIQGYASNSNEAATAINKFFESQPIEQNPCVRLPGGRMVPLPKKKTGTKVSE